MDKYSTLKQKGLRKLSLTAKHFFKLLHAFGNQKKLEKTVKLVIVDDNIQTLDTDYCGPFQMYFYLNLFENSVVVNSKKLNIELISKLLNELFRYNNTRDNERILDNFILHHNIDFGENNES